MLLSTDDTTSHSDNNKLYRFMAFVPFYESPPVLRLEFLLQNKYLGLTHCTNGSSYDLT